MPSFDIVSKIDMQEVDNAVNQTKKEVATRYDFRGSKSQVDLEKDQIKLLADDDFKMKALRDILESKLVRRGVSLKSLEFQKEEEAGMGMRRQCIKLISGISKEKAKNIVALIKDTKLKVQGAIQDEQVRVSGKSIDDLQSIIQLLKDEDVGVALQFINLRS